MINFIAQLEVITHILYSLQQIEHILCGSNEIGDLSLLRLNTQYKGEYTDESPIIQWFWVRKFFETTI
jgi:hypothetical protein